jgi:hypothetical protein
VFLGGPSVVVMGGAGGRGAKRRFFGAEHFFCFLLNPMPRNTRKYDQQNRGKGRHVFFVKRFPPLIFVAKDFRHGFFVMSFVVFLNYRT